MYFQDNLQVMIDIIQVNKINMAGSPRDVLKLWGLSSKP